MMLVDYCGMCKYCHIPWDKEPCSSVNKTGSGMIAHSELKEAPACYKPRNEVTDNVKQYY